MAIYRSGAPLVGALLLVFGLSSANAQDVVLPADAAIGRMSPADMTRLRQKAWGLFNQVRFAGLPQSREWFIAGEAFRNETCTRSVPGLPTPLAAEESSEDADKVLAIAPEPPKKRRIYETTFFNRQACLDIHDKDFPLNDKTTTNRLRALSRREINEFHPSAMVIKTFWRPLPTDDSPVEVGIWQWPTEYTIDRQYTENHEWKLETIPEESWKSSPVCVLLKPPPGSPCLKAEDFFPMARVDRRADFPCKVTEDDVNRCGDLRDGQWLVLLGVHVISKESPDWLWTTFWWKGVGRTSGASWTCDNADRDAISGPWGNFSANVTNSFKRARPRVDPNEVPRCGVPGKIGLDRHMEEYLATYNPFVEGVLKNGGRKSSCIVCHARANTRSSGVDRVRIPAVGEIEWPPITEFEGSIRTDYLWTIRSHIGP